jgi:hypothetical protein
LNFLAAKKRRHTAAIGIVDLPSRTSMVGQLREGAMVIRVAMIAAGMLLGAIVNASAQQYLMFGQGLESCGTWTQARQERSSQAGLAAQSL